MHLGNHHAVLPLVELLLQIIPLATPLHHLLVILLCVPGETIKYRMYKQELHLCRNISWKGTRQIPQCSSRLLRAAKV